MKGLKWCGAEAGINGCSMAEYEIKIGRMPQDVNGYTRIPLNKISHVRNHGLPLLGFVCLLVLAGCGTPTARVEVVPSDKPITINLNIKIDHEVRVKVEKELNEVLSKDSKLF